MNSCFVAIVAMSFASSIMFGAILFLEYIYKTKYVEYIYFMMKLVLIIYLIPTVVGIHIIVQCGMSYTVSNIYGDDFLNVLGLKYFDISMLSDGQKIIMIALCIWGIGVAGNLVNSIIKGKIVIKKIIRNSEEVTIKEVHEMLREIKTELEIKRQPHIFQSHIVATPFITGIFNPTIVFPNKLFTKEEWGLMLRHELNHLKAHDVLYKFIVGIVQIMHWFNPVVYFYKKSFYVFSEYVCDKRTAASIDKQQKVQYARLIVHLSSLNKAQEHISALGDTNYMVIERRVVEIMKKPTKEKSILLIGTVTAFVTLCPIVSYATAMGTMDVQGKIIETKYDKKITEDVMVDGAAIAINEVLDESGAKYVRLATTRGLNNIDINVPAGGLSIFNTLTLTKGKEITISLASDKSSDSFSVNIVNASDEGTRYTSSKGMVSAAYTVPADGSYKVYINNKIENEIHITGIIRIE